MNNDNNNNMWLWYQAQPTSPHGTHFFTFLACDLDVGLILPKTYDPKTIAGIFLGGSAYCHKFWYE